MLIFLSSFLIFIILQSIFINGVYLSMEGRETIDENGLVKGEGNILYPIKRYFSQSSKEIKFVGLDGFNRIKSAVELKYGKRMPDMKVAVTGDIVAVEVTAENRPLVIGYFESLKLNEQFKFSSSEDWLDLPKIEGVEYLVLYKEKVKYKFNSFFRKSLGGACIRCMASFFGGLTFLPAFLYFGGGRWELFPLMIFDIFALVFVNNVLHKL